MPKHNPPFKRRKVTSQHAVSFDKARFTRRKLTLLVLAASQLITGTGLAGPFGGSIVGGVGAIDQVGRDTTIKQDTQRLAIDWDSFNVDVDESVTVSRVEPYSGKQWLRDSRAY